MSNSEERSKTIKEIEIKNKINYLKREKETYFSLLQHHWKSGMADSSTFFILQNEIDRISKEIAKLKIENDLPMELEELILPPYDTRPLEMINKTGTQRFEEITEQMLDTYIKKNSDYGDSFGNLFRRFGLLSSVIRLNDKLSRLETLSHKEAKVKDESIRDTLIDMANYCILTVIEIDKHE